VSFLAAPYLLGLIALPGLILWYAGRNRQRARAALAFAAPQMSASVAPHRPGWRRHAPMVAFLLAIGALIVAAARPRITLTVPVRQLTSMLALDMSGSMQATDVAPNRATAAQRAADQFTTTSPSQVSIGVMQFNQTPTLLQAPTHSRSSVLSALGSLHIGGGTSIGSALQTALSLLAPNSSSATTGASSSGAPSAGSPSTASPSGATAAAIVLLSDGGSTSGPDPLASARQAARLHIPIFTVSLGTAQGTITTHAGKDAPAVTKSVPPDPQALARIAQLSGGQAYTAADAGRLSDIYRQLSVKLAHQRESHDLTAYLVGAGLLLSLLGSALTLTWFGRLI
jgi:Ca-activated chloride channel homolog